MDKEVEEVSFLPGETILNKKAVYEPTKGQRFRQVVCTRGWAIAILMLTGTIMVGIALIAAFARPSTPICDSASGSGELNAAATSSAAAASGSSRAAPGGSEGGAPAKEEQTYIATNGEPFPWKDLRLPKALVPLNYSILLHPNISRSEFIGKVVITFHVAEETDAIVFHLNELNVSHVSVSLGKTMERFDQSLTIAKELEYITNQQYYVQLSETLSAGSFVQLSVKFSGKLVKDAMDGFYLSSYMVNGEERYMASTQFESTDARKAFPCMDEPAFKATFQLSIVREARHITLFNMPLKKTEPYGDSPDLILDTSYSMANSPDSVIDVYQATPKMSTYLVAFIVCDFKHISAETSAGTQVRVYAPEDKIYMGKYALDAAVAILENYTSFFGLPYDLPKADLVAIPNFAAGAMENWGLITYRDTAILYDPAVSSEFSKKWVTEVVAHELAHQWFGNLVTMDWWDDLWLNEGFATFVQFMGLDVVDKSFHGQNSLAVKYADAMYQDSLVHSHPIKVPVTKPSEIASVFDQISYQKGSSVINMLESVVGKSGFRRGLKNYLSEHAYGNAVTGDLWRAWQQVSEVPDLSVPDMMDTWTLQMGYPVVNVAWDGHSLHLSQARFLLSGKEPGQNDVEKYKSPFGYKWYIPFTFTTSDQPDKTTLKFLKEESMQIPLSENSGGGTAKWVKANKDLAGFYRVNYDAQGWKALTDQLKKDHRVFSVNDRIGLMDDAFSLARAGLLNYSTVFDMVQYMSEETDFFVWTTVLPHFSFVLKRLELEEEYDLAREMLLTLVRPGVTSLGWGTGGDVNTRQLRASLITTAISAEDQASVDQARALFEGWKKDQNTSLNNNLRFTIYKTGVKFGNKQDWDVVYDRYFNSKVASEKSNLLLSLGSSRDVRVLQILLEYSLDTDKVKSQDSASVLSMVAANRNGLLQAWRFLRQNWALLIERYGVTSSIIRKMVQIVASFNTQFDLEEVNAFFQDKNMGSAARPLQQALELVESHVAWGRMHMPEVKTWLQSNIKQSAT